MTQIVTVQWHDLEYFSPDEGSDKFYRGYNFNTGDNRAVFQYGRRGSVGSFKVDTGASRKVVSTLEGKRRKGYEDASHGDFDIDLGQVVKCKTDKELGTLLDTVRQANRGKTTVVIPPRRQTAGVTSSHAAPSSRRLPAGSSAPASGVGLLTTQTVTVDRLDQLADEALDAITTAATDPAKVSLLYVELTEKFGDLTENYDRIKSYLATLEMLIADTLS